MKAEAIICFVNALNISNSTQAKIIAHLGLTRVLRQTLASDSTKVVLTGLECVDYLLKQGRKIQEESHLAHNPFLLDLESEGAIQTIEGLQGHQSDEVYKKVSEIIDTYFEYATTAEYS